MSDFSHHEPCPNCGGSDPVGVWADGHKYCFSCGWGEGWNGQYLSVPDLRNKLIREEKTSNARNVANLPADFDYSIRADALEWLRKYEVSNEEIARYRIGWSDARQLLVFPCFDNYGGLLFCQSRYFGTDAKHPRYLTSGSSEAVFNVMDSSGRRDSDNALRRGDVPLVLVEDHVSGIRVARQFPCMPLYGSQISNYQLRILSDRVTSLVIWLDADKIKTAIQARFRAGVYFDSVKVVFSEHDPKVYDDDRIRGFVQQG